MSKNGINFHVIANSSRRSLAAGSACPVTLVPVFSSESEGAVGKLPKRLAGYARMSGFKGSSGQTLATPGPGRTASGTTFVHFGLGNRSSFSLEIWRKALTGAVKKAKTLHGDKIALVLPKGIASRRGLLGGSASLWEIGKVTAETISLVAYQPNNYKTAKAEGGHKEEPRITDVHVSAHQLADDDSRELKRGLITGAGIGSSVNLARDAANKPANMMTPSDLAQLALQVVREWADDGVTTDMTHWHAANKSGDTLELVVYGDNECRELGMNAFLTVAKGSPEPPKFITLDYSPANCRADGPVLGLVGKSLTFDSGGLDLKSAAGMRDMKYDMCGGADVIAAMRAIAHLGLPIRVKAFCAAAENMPGPSAYRPGDVYVGLDGKSYEIDNTDAEGRLTLVDAIAFARIHGGVTHIVDYATLTGAILVALGDVAAGVFANNQEFADKFLACARAEGESAFQLPTWDEFKTQNESKIADLKNAGGSNAGSITAALFVLSAARDIPAVHVDIAGVSNRSRELGMDPSGGTGWGVRTLIKLAAEMAKQD